MAELGDRPSARASVYITDGPELFRTKDDHLLMLGPAMSSLTV